MGDLLYQSGDCREADGAYQNAIALLEPQLQRMVQLERHHSGKEVMREVREEVVYQEVRNPETGFLTHVAVPVTSFDMELSEAPEEILQRQASLRSKLVDCHFGRAKCQFRLGKADAGADQVGKAFEYAPQEASMGLEAIVFEDYETAADELVRPGRRSRSQPSLLMRYLVTQIALDDIREAKKTQGRLKRSAEREDARWAEETLAYFGEYVSYLNGRQISATEEIDRLAEARAAFYKGQLHLMQQSPDLAKPFLEQAAASEAVLGLEGKAATIQLAMLDQPSS